MLPMSHVPCSLTCGLAACPRVISTIGPVTSSHGGVASPRESYEKATPFYSPQSWGGGRAKSTQPQREYWPGTLALFGDQQKTS